MKKLLALALIFLGTFAWAYAGGVNISSSANINVSSGNQLNIGGNAPLIDGFSTHPPTSDPALSTYYAQMVAAGATYSRTDLDWGAIQATSSASYVWGNYDTKVNEGDALGINTVFIIDQTPTWAAYPTCTAGAGKCAPVNAATVATFAAAAAAHFQGRVKYWEFWNEQNLAGNWGPAPTTTDYVNDLNASYTAIKAVDPTDTVISGGLAPAADVSGVSISPTTMVTGYYADGATFDGLGMHPYTYPNDLTTGGTGWQAMLTIRSTMVANGDSAKKIWVTEYGAPTCGPGSPKGLNATPFVNGSDYMTLEAQAQMAYLVIAQLQSLTYIAHFFWYTLVDQNSLDNSTPENCFGAYYTNGTPKPVFWVIKNS